VSTEEVAALREACLQARERRGRVIAVAGDSKPLLDAMAGEPGWTVRRAPIPATKASDRETFEQWEQTLEELVVASSQQPVMWIVENAGEVHARELLAFLAPAIRALPVAILTTGRPPAPSADPRALALAAAARARDANDADAFANAALVIGDQLHLEEALERLCASGSWNVTGTTEPHPLHCRVRAHLAGVLRAPRAAIAAAREAISDARDLADPALLADVLGAILGPLAEQLDPVELRELATEYRALVADDLPRALVAGEHLVLAAGRAGDFAALDQLLDATLQLAARAGHPRLTARTHLLASMRSVARGQFADSERSIGEVERAAQIVADPALTRAFGLHRHYRAIDLHRETTTAKGVAELELGALERGVVAARFGDAGTAARSLLGVVADDLDSPSQLALLGEVCAAGGNNDQRAQVLARLQPFADRHAFTGYSYAGPVRRVIGLLEHALGNRGAGDQQLRRALDTCRTHGLATWVARISFELGLLEEAGRLAANIGIRGLAKRTGTATDGVAPPTRPSLGVWREPEGWRVSLGIRVEHVADHRGMDIIARLVARPGEEVHEIVLAGSRQERAQVRPWIREALARIRDNSIADYLRSAIRVGTFCTFRP